jgi:hypothetical protein
MTLYWLLFSIPAIMALTYPVHSERDHRSVAQGFAFMAFLTCYFLIALLRYETGGDWKTYVEMFEDMRGDTLGYALQSTDSLFGLLNWVSAQLGTGPYLVNGVCSWFLGYGTVRVAMRMRDPWLAVLIAVPYLLIVVGMGYVRQAAAIGLVLIGLDSLDRSKPFQTLLFLVAAIGFHSTAVVVVPLFAWALTRRYKIA